MELAYTVASNTTAFGMRVRFPPHGQISKRWFQPGFVSKQRLMQVLGNQWKEELGQGYQSWKGLSGKIKESKLKYRFQLNPLNAVFRKRNRKSYVEFLTFFNKV